MKRSLFILTLTVLALALFAAGCTLDAPSSGVTKPSLGSVTVTKYVAVGNSLAAGYQSNALFESGQIYSYPNVIAGQLVKAGANLGTFQQPTYSDPGNADPLTGKAARYDLISLADPNNPVIGPKGLTAGAPTNSALTRAYDNLGVPGAVIFDYLDTTNIATKAALPRANPFFQLVLRNQAGFGKSIHEQVKKLNTATPIGILSFWLGNNDVLGFATSGGYSPNAPTSSGAFAALYKQALDSLRAILPNTKIIVGTIPDIQALPFFTTVGPKMAAGVAAAKAANPAIVGLFYQKHGEAVATTFTNFTEATPPLITLKGSPFAGLLGLPTGQFYRDFWASNSAALIAGGLPNFATYFGFYYSGLDTTKAFGFDPKNPWPDALTLDAAEQATAAASTSAFNATIATEAAAHSCEVFDAYAIFNTIKAGGYVANGLTFSTAYITGGLFSLDGVHPTSRGAVIMANEFIRIMNTKWGMNVQYADVSAAPGLPAPIYKTSAAGKSVVPVIPYSAFKSFDMLFPASTR